MPAEVTMPDLRRLSSTYACQDMVRWKEWTCRRRQARTRQLLQCSSSCCLSCASVGGKRRAHRRTEERSSRTKVLCDAVIGTFLRRLRRSWGFVSSINRALKLVTTGLLSLGRRRRDIFARPSRMGRPRRGVARHALEGSASVDVRSRAVDWVADWVKACSASEWAVWIATSVLCAGTYARHGLPLATLYFLATAALCAIDPSLHSLQLLNLAAVVYDLSFELHRLYMLVSNRPMLMVAIMIVALAVEWLLERYEAEDSNDERPRGALGGIARLGRSVGRMLLPAVMGVLIACVGWLVLTAALLHPSSFSAPLVEAVEQVRPSLRRRPCAPARGGGAPRAPRELGSADRGGWNARHGKMRATGSAPDETPI